MRVALVITELHPGGAETCFVNLACYLQSQGHEVRVWQLWPDPPPERRQLVEQLIQQGIPWSSGGARSAWHFLPATRWLRRELKAFQPDVVQAFLFHANVATAIALRGLTNGLVTRFFGGARVAQPQRWRWWLQRWAAKRMEKLICVSQSVVEHCHQVEKIPDDKLLAIPNGVDIPSTSNQDTLCWSTLGLPVNSRVLLFVGRLTEQKGIVEFLTRVGHDVLVQLPEHQLVLMGEGEQESQLRAIVHAWPTAARVHLVGWQPRAIEWMRRAELIVLPARYEGMPNVILEAMAVGRPVVSFAVDGVGELLGESAAANAQMVAPLDWQTFSKAIVLLANDLALRSRCGQANEERVSQHFQRVDQLARYERLYLAQRSEP